MCEARLDTEIADVSQDCQANQHIRVSPWIYKIKLLRNFSFCFPVGAASNSLLGFSYSLTPTLYLRTTTPQADIPVLT